MQNTQKKVVLIGGPGTGKTTVLNALIKKGFCCFEEVSREVTLEAQKKGIEQLFLTKPLLFSKMLLEGRERQYLEANEKDASIVFFDRGIPDVKAYLEFFKTDYTDEFKQKSINYKYDIIFHFAPWKAIYTSDNERYESFAEACEIDKFLLKTYEELGYTIINVPFDSIENRVAFILKYLKIN